MNCPMWKRTKVLVVWNTNNPREELLNCFQSAIVFSQTLQVAWSQVGKTGKSNLVELQKRGKAPCLQLFTSFHCPTVQKHRWSFSAFSCQDELATCWLLTSQMTEGSQVCRKVWISEPTYTFSTHIHSSWDRNKPLARGYICSRTLWQGPGDFDPTAQLIYKPSS